MPLPSTTGLILYSDNTVNPVLCDIIFWYVQCWRSNYLDVVGYRRHDPHAVFPVAAKNVTSVAKKSKKRITLQIWNEKTSQANSIHTHSLAISHTRLVKLWCSECPMQPQVWKCMCALVICVLARARAYAGIRITGEAHETKGFLLELTGHESQPGFHGCYGGIGAEKRWRSLIFSISPKMTAVWAYQGVCRHFCHSSDEVEGAF